MNNNNNINDNSDDIDKNSKIIVTHVATCQKRKENRTLCGGKLQSPPISPSKLGFTYLPYSTLSANSVK